MLCFPRAMCSHGTLPGSLSPWGYRSGEVTACRLATPQDTESCRPGPFLAYDNRGCLESNTRLALSIIEDAKSDALGGKKKKKRSLQTVGVPSNKIFWFNFTKFTKLWKKCLSRCYWFRLYWSNSCYGLFSDTTRNSSFNIIGTIDLYKSLTYAL